ncbi:hypothetical protein [Companilactobacillus sp. HBUAS59699]|uniref:hypothetical protein n=1 Tax=Companilactobacillus sp. HBUAS59699 TaxID=3109358 RepID=UPI002FEF8A68
MSLRKLLVKGRNSTWFTFSTFVAIIIWITMLIMYFRFHVNVIKNFNALALLSVSVSGLSFSMTLLVALVAIFGSKDMGTFYKWSEKYKNDKSDDSRFVFYDTFAPYAWVAILFAVTGLISLFLGTFNLSIFDKFCSVNFVLKSFDIISLGLAIWSLMDLMIDTILSRISKIIRENRKK